MSVKTVRAREIAQTVRDDAERDVSAYEGRELSGSLFGEIVGNSHALIVGLANCVETLADEVERLERQITIPAPTLQRRGW